MFGFGRKETIFDVAKRTGKKIAFIIFEDKIFVTLAEKTAEGKVKLKVYRNYKWEDIEVQVEPLQEFTIHTPRLSLMKVHNVFNYLMDRDFTISSPSDVFLNVEPYNVEGIIIVYPYEVLSRETLKLMGLRDTGKVKEIDLTKFGIREKKNVKIYSPDIFALDKQSIKMISARSRISQIDTILTMLKELVVKSEGLMKAPFAAPGLSGIKTLLAKKEFWFLIILLGIAAIALIFLPNMLSNISQVMKPITPPAIPRPNITGAGTFP
jgi:hypothetical protein